MVSQCDLIEKFKFKNFQNCINGSFLANLYTLKDVNRRKDQNGQLKDIELILVNNKNQESSIYLTDFDCSNGLLQSHWLNFVQTKVGFKKWYKNYVSYYDEMNKPKKFEELYQDNSDLKM